MTMEKNGEIQEGFTPPEIKDCDTKCGCHKAGEDVVQLDEHLAKRLAEKTAEQLKKE